MIDGRDNLMGVVWGRWLPNTNISGINNPLKALSYISGSYITKSSDFLNVPIGIRNSATYNSVGGNIIKDGNAVMSGIITGSAVVDFTAQAISNYTINITNSPLGNFNAVGSGTINDFVSSPGINLVGSCNGMGVCYTGVTVYGKAHGAFVGHAAEGLISAYNLNLSNASGVKVGGVIYMKR